MSILDIIAGLLGRDDLLGLATAATAAGWVGALYAVGVTGRRQARGAR